jgi:uroporphyrinogen decarboxylase
VETDADVLGIGPGIRLGQVRKVVPDGVGLQGNLDPALLAAAPREVAAETARILEEMRGQRGHIFNLGHGVSPDAKLETISALVETVKKFK